MVRVLEMFTGGGKIVCDVTLEDGKPRIKTFGN